MLNNLTFCNSQVKIAITDKTTLADLVGLNLHNYEDEVKNVVDKGNKEHDILN